MAALHTDAIKTVKRAALKVTLAEAALQIIALSMPESAPVQPVLIPDDISKQWFKFGATSVAASAASIALAALNNMKTV